MNGFKKIRCAQKNCCTETCTLQPAPGRLVETEEGVLEIREVMYQYLHLPHGPLERRDLRWEVRGRLEGAAVECQLVCMEEVRYNPALDAADAYRPWAPCR